jgi:hypothetical protein
LLLSDAPTALSFDDVAGVESQVFVLPNRSKLTVIFGVQPA